LTDSPSPKKVPKVLWWRKHWYLRENPFPGEGIARLGGADMRENGLLFQPDVQREQVNEAIEKFVIGAAFSGLKFGYLWSLGSGLSADQRGFGKSSLLQYLVEKVNQDFGASLITGIGLDDSDAEEHATCALLASFDMANARSLAAVFFQATHYACRFRIEGQPTLTNRLRERLIARLGTDDQKALEDAVNGVFSNLRGRTLGPPNTDLIRLLCAGDDDALAQHIESVKAGSRARVGAANYLATFLLFAKAAGIQHVIMGCDQLEDFAATSTTRQKRTVETERFRDYVLELQPMADMLSTVVTLHPRAAQAIGEMWRLADLPNFEPDRQENAPRIVILEALETAEQAHALLKPYLDSFRDPNGPEPATPFAPFADDAIEVLLDRSNGKPRDLLRKANALIEHCGEANRDVIDGRTAATILDSIAVPEDDELIPVAATSGLEDQWTY
jgi:hypothetical protein